MSSQQVWGDVGFHPTPFALVRAFVNEVIGAAENRMRSGSVMRILDACAGDGRLGHALARRLLARGYLPSVTFVEADPQRAIEIRSARSYRVTVLARSIFEYDEQDKFDIVISNPPYLTLSNRLCFELGLDWEEARRGGRNLYGMAMQKYMTLCRPAGILGLLAPHGWLSNIYAKPLRQSVAKASTSVSVSAFSSRTLFPDVNQDTAIQIFRMRGNSKVTEPPVSVTIRYDYGRFVPVELVTADHIKTTERAKVRVGPFVWNRQQDLMGRQCDSAIPVLYGGNISSKNSLEMSVKKYERRQFLARARCPPAYISRAPFIGIKRSMRGCPGSWRLDFVVVTKRSFECVGENHTIIVELPESMPRSEIMRAVEKIKLQIEDEHKHFGHANLSVTLVKRAVMAADL